MKCIGKYSKLISVLLLTVVMATGCGITDLLGTKNVVAEYEAENYNKDLYTGKLFASDLCVASGVKVSVAYLRMRLIHYILLRCLMWTERK